MATGILGQSTLTAATNTTVYTVPATKTGTFNVSIVNRGNSADLVRLAIASTATPSNAEYLEYDVVLSANGVLERTGIVAQAGEQVVAYANGSNISVSVYGYEE